MPAAVAAAFLSVPMEGEVCGRCTGYDADRCNVRGYRVKAKDSGCDWFVREG